MNAETPYGLTRPTLSDARDAVFRVHSSDAALTWEKLLRSADLTGRETGDADRDRLLDVMAAADPTTRLCALALRIRVASHTHLSAAHTMTRS